MSALYVYGAGVLGPGLPGWAAARRVLRNEQPYRYEMPPEPKPEMLPQNERRRGARTVRWAMAVAQEAMQGSGIRGADVASVFASSSGDGETLHQICEALAMPAREVSPTRFHNSVHNAASGYWSIASGSRHASVTVCGHDASFAVALLEAAALVQAGEAPVLLVAYDLPYPEPLLSVRQIREPLAIALLLCAAARTPTLATWHVSLASQAATPRAAGTWPAQLESNPAAPALALLAAVARGEAEVVRIALGDGQSVAVDSRP